jgi:Ca2+-binding EF-hand superfamily protein
VLSSNFFSYDKDTGKITFNTDAIAEAFGEDVDLETIFNSMEVYSVTTSPVEDKFDLNGDGNVSADDLLSFKVVYNNIIRGKVSYDDVEQYDLNGDGTINILDMLEIKRQILGTSKNK